MAEFRKVQNFRSCDNYSSPFSLEKKRENFCSLTCFSFRTLLFSAEIPERLIRLILHINKEHSLAEIATMCSTYTKGQTI